MPTNPDTPKNRPAPPPPPPPPNETMTKGRPLLPLATAFQNGWITAAEVRESEGLLPQSWYGPRVEGPLTASKIQASRLAGMRSRRSEPRSIPRPRVWYYAWRIAAMAGWAGGCWLLAELV
jgi:hypothetical protein